MNTHFCPSGSIARLGGIALVVAGVCGHRELSADGPFSEMVVFGASFENASIRVTNGLLWNEWLASELDMPAPGAAPQGGTNYAAGGDPTWLMKTQVRQYLGDHIPTNSTLFVFGFVGNDFIMNRNIDPASSASNIVDMVSQLASAGGKSFVIPTQTIGTSPYTRPRAEDWERFFSGVEGALNPKLNELEANLGLTVYRPDILRLFEDVQKNPRDFGLTNTTVPIGNVENPHEFLWWDDVHPTTAMHRLMGHEAFKAMDLTVQRNPIPLRGSGDTYRQDFEELGRGPINTRLPAGWVGVTDDAVYTSITGSSPRRIGAGGSLYTLGPSGDRALAMGITDSSQQNEIQLYAEVTDANLGALRLQFDVEAWAVNKELAVTPGEAVFGVSIETDMGGGYIPLVDFGKVTTGSVLTTPERGSTLDGNANVNRISFDSGLLRADIPSASMLRVRWAVPSDSQTAGWTFGVDNVELSVFGQLQAGDADQDFDFDQFDLIRVQQTAKYLSGQPATWGEGDWDGAPGGSQGNPPAGDGVFDQFDIIAALQGATYLTGSYAVVLPSGQPDDRQKSIGYDSNTGEIWVDAPVGTELTSVNIDSAAGIFTGSPAQNLDQSFDNDADSSVFKATFGGSFGSLSFGTAAQHGLSEQFLLNDLTLEGSLAGGGALGDVDLIYVPIPEPSTLFLSAMAVVVPVRHAWQQRRRRRTH